MKAMLTRAQSESHVNHFPMVELEFEVIPRKGEWVSLHKSQIDPNFLKAEPNLKINEAGFLWMIVDTLAHVMDPLNGHFIIIYLIFNID